jgi:NAD(P)-dependent dehydrogenase (short-subunit alcohol dehydrogenase family)
MADLRGRTALVTGGAKRLGRAIAELLAGEGVSVVVHYGRSASEAEETAEALRARGVEAWTLGADLSSADAAGDLVGRACEKAGRALQILVNSASVFSPSHVLEFSPDELSEQLAVNAVAPLLLSRQFAARAESGQIINMLDTRIVEYDAAHAAYHLSKRALFSLTRMLALELAPRIRVNAIAPGLILPPPREDESYLEAMADTVPLKMHGSAEDIVRAVRFLLHSQFVTGQVIYVDGGRHMEGRTYGS